MRWAVWLCCLAVLACGGSDRLTGDLGAPPPEPALGAYAIDSVEGRPFRVLSFPDATRQGWLVFAGDGECPAGEGLALDSVIVQAPLDPSTGTVLSVEPANRVQLIWMTATGSCYDPDTGVAGDWSEVIAQQEGRWEATARPDSFTISSTSELLLDLLVVEGGPLILRSRFERTGEVLRIRFRLQ